MTLQADLTQSVATVVADSGVLHAIVHGPAAGPTSQVTTDGGPVKTPARVMAEAEQAVGGITAAVAATADDRAAVSADKVTVAADKAIVAADKNTVADDKTTVAADKAIVAADKATVQADKAIVEADKVTVQADKVIVAADKTAAAASATTATTQAGIATTKAGESSTSAAAALASELAAAQSAIDAADASNVNTFTHVAVAGQSTIDAEQAGDTLTLAAGANIALTTNAATDTVTVAVTGLGNAASKNVGTAAGTVAAGDDGRFALAGTSIQQGKHSVTWTGDCFGAVATNTAAIQQISEVTGTNTHILGADFSGTTQQYAWVWCQMPKSYNGGALEIYISSVRVASASTNFGVVWSAAAAVVSPGATANAAYGTFVDAPAASDHTNQYETKRTGAMAVTPAGTFADGGVLFIKLTRKVANAGDTLASLIRATAVTAVITLNAATDA